MRPDTRVWRKASRAARKGATGGRSNPRPVLIQAPSRGSTWLRRHPNDFGYWLSYAGARKLIDPTRTAAPRTGTADHTATPERTTRP